MKRLYLPVVFDKDTVVEVSGGAKIVFEDAAMAYHDPEAAKEAGRKLALRSSKTKVVLFEACMVIEPRKVEFAEKEYNKSGELIA